MSQSALNEALAVIEASRNFMAGLIAHPDIREDAREKVAKHIDALDRYLNEALGEDDD